ncbi:hypothetical protein SAMN05444146_3826 [Flavobacterium johnsoniae]|nr:hypothetical protein SAMN05444146_3826 [Flavobacterium johnsoniae]
MKLSSKSAIANGQNLQKITGIKSKKKEEYSDLIICTLNFGNTNMKIISSGSYVHRIGVYKKYFKRRSEIISSANKKDACLSRRLYKLTVIVWLCYNYVYCVWTFTAFFDVISYCIVLTDAF